MLLSCGLRRNHPRRNHLRSRSSRLHCFGRVDVKQLHHASRQSIPHEDSVVAELVKNHNTLLEIIGLGRQDLIQKQLDILIDQAEKILF